MRFTWNYSFDTEINRLLFTTRQIANNFYSRNNFLLSDTTHGYGKSNTVVLPNINFSQIPNFWKRVSTINIDLINTPHYSQIKSQISKLVKNENISNFRIGKSLLKKSWEKHQSIIFNLLSQIIPDASNKFTDINIFVTAYGTTCSFSTPKKFPAAVNIIIRQDQGITQIVESLLSCLTRSSIESDLAGKWSESEMVVDWLLTKSTLGQYLKKNDPLHSHQTLKSTRLKQVNSNDTRLQNKILAQIGFVTSTKNLLASTDLSSLTSKELSIYNFLIQKYPQPASNEEIAQILWPENHWDDFSLTALSKTIERLRQKLINHGLPATTIQTWRKHGYSILS